MEFHPQDILFHVINIGVLYLLLRVLIYEPVRRFLDAREDRVKTQLSEAQQAELRTEELNRELTETRLKAEEEMREFIASSTRHARENGEAIVTDARLKADAILAEAHERIMEESRRIKRQTHNDVASAAIELAQRMVGQKITLEDNRALTEAFFLALREKEGEES